MLKEKVRESRYKLSAYYGRNKHCYKRYRVDDKLKFILCSTMIYHDQFRVVRYSTITYQRYSLDMLANTFKSL